MTLNPNYVFEKNTGYFTYTLVQRKCLIKSTEINHFHKYFVRFVKIGDKITHFISLNLVISFFHDFFILKNQVRFITENFYDFIIFMTIQGTSIKLSDKIIDSSYHLCNTPKIGS